MLRRSDYLLDAPLAAYSKQTKCKACGEEAEHVTRYFPSCNDSICKVTVPHMHRMCLNCNHWWCERPLDILSPEKDPRYS